MRIQLDIGVKSTAQAQMSIIYGHTPLHTLLPLSFSLENVNYFRSLFQSFLPSQSYS